MRNTAIAMALLCVSACANTIPEETPQESEDVWITIGADALDAVHTALDDGTLKGAIKTYATSEEATVVKVRRDQIADLTRLMHDEFHRCGGYVVHDSRKEATRALDHTLAEEAARKVFAGYSIDNGAVVQTLMGELQATQIKSVISTLAGYTNRYYTTQTGVDAAVWIRDLWQSYAEGRTDVTVELFDHAGYPQQSVILTVTGDTYPDEVVVLGAHLDSTAGFSPGPGTVAPGADDDASGIATLSEVIRVAMANGFAPDRTVKFMGYAAEEVGLRGSGDIVDTFQAQGINVIGVMQLDMTNYNGSAEDITLIDDYTNAAQNQFVGDLINTYTGLSWTYTTCGYACSDHASWHNAGYVASFPFEARFSDYNPYIHTSSDTLSNSGGDAQHAIKFARVATAYMGELAKGALDGDIGGGTPPPPPPEPTTETFSGDVAQGEEDHYGAFSVEPGTTFTADITGTGDADLYVRFGAAPTTSSYDCRPYKSGSTESCSLSVPSGETEAYVMVRGYTSATYDLTVTYTPNEGGEPPPPPPSEVTENFSGSVATGAEDHYGAFSVLAGTTFTAQTSGTGDADLYVRFGAAPTTSAYDCRPYKWGSSETCSLTVPTGETEAYVMVRGYEASTYDLTVTYTPNP